MLNSLVAVIAIIGFVLPGFIASRVAAGQRAQPASITDLELVLRALAYALVIQGLFVATGWTTSLINKIDSADADWGRYRWEIIGFAAAVLTSAFLLGLLVGAALRWLEGGPMRQTGRTQTLAMAAFHAVGGQDARDAFDYVIERRRERDEQFIVVVRVSTNSEDDDGLRAGLYGTRSYSGLSPRPHDVYLEEVWEFVERGVLRRKRPDHGAWFPASEIKDLWFRTISPDEIARGQVRDFRWQTLTEALEQDRNRLLREIVDKAEEVDAPSKAQLESAVDHARDRHDELTAQNAGYSEWTGWREDLLAAAAVASALVRQEDPEYAPGAALMGSIRPRMRAVSQIDPSWDKWLFDVDYYTARLTGESDDKYTLIDLTAHLAAGMWRVEGFEPEWWTDDEG